MAGTVMLARCCAVHGGCPAVPWQLLVTQGCACCCLLWGLVLPAGCQLKLKPNQAQPELRQGTGSAGDERGRNVPGGLPWGPRACAAAWGGDAFWGPSARQVPATVLQSGTAALLQAHSWVSCYSDIS